MICDLRNFFLGSRNGILFQYKLKYVIVCQYELLQLGKFSRLL